MDWNSIESWVRSWTPRGIILGIVVMLIVLALLFGGKSEAKTLVSPDGRTTQEVSQVQVYNPFPVQPFTIGMDTGDILECQPLDPRGIYVCRFHQKPQ